MLKAFLTSINTLALAAMATAQNLVPNPSFEDTIDCDLVLSCDLLKATHWQNPNTATPDLYDCDLERACGYPMDPNDVDGVVQQGYQYAYEGLRYAAAFQWFGPVIPAEQDSREYLMVQLTEELEPLQSYAVSLFYSRAEGFRYAIDHLSVFFGPESLFQSTGTALNVEPQIALHDPLNTYLEEGSDWIQLVDTFQATGNERWMVIGTFEDADEVNGIEATPTILYQSAYYYIDQVSVVHVNADVGIQDFSAWYVGYGSVGIRRHNSRALERVRLFDQVGRVVLATVPIGSGADYRLEVPMGLAAGCYLLEGWSGGQRSVTRFVKQIGMP